MMFHLLQQPAGLLGPGLFPTLSGHGHEARPGPKVPHSVIARTGPSDRPFLELPFERRYSGDQLPWLLLPSFSLALIFWPTFIEHSVSLRAALSLLWKEGGVCMFN